MIRWFCVWMCLLGAASGLVAQDFWQPINTGLTEPTIRSIKVAPSGTLFTGTTAGVFRSTNQGGNWSHLAATGDATIQSLWIDEAGRIFAGAEHGVFLSTDNGNSWSLRNAGFPDTLVLAVATDGDGRLFAGTDLAGLYRSTDLGASWSKLTTGLTSENINVLLCLAGGVVIAGTDGEGMYRSTDHGDTWTAADSGLTDLYVYAIAASPGGAPLFIGTNIGGVFRSTDLGVSWEAVNNGLTSSAVTSLLCHPDGSVFVGTGGDGVFRSLDAGGSWQGVSTGLTDLFVYALEVDSSRYVYAGTITAGDFRSVSPVTAVADAAADLPTAFSLLQNYPNPFNPSTTIAFELAAPSLVTLRVYSLLGSCVATLADEELRGAGAHRMDLNAGGLASGVYFYRLDARPAGSTGLGRASAIRAMTLVR